MTTITTTVRTLQDLVGPVLPLASNDSYLPVLNAVLIESRGKWLTAAATDRYVMGLKRVAADEGEWPEFRALVSIRGLKSILATFKASRGSDPEIMLTIDGDQLTVEASGGLVDDLAGQRATYHLVTGEYVKLDSLIAKCLAAEPAAMVAGFNWGFLSKFSAAIPRNGSLEFRSAASEGAASVVVGENFVGCIMPTRRVEATTNADWADMFDLGAKKKVA